ncbi:ATP-binding protein [Roseomonas fluvialis]|uniref:AAA+ ATPase domain-containing protein n=1 Tax=Roseomonas fluvialis TaxID=1750527 RepID=A0ABN6P4A7_9PROT|nr:ATP-binding protein [Roseomonas fluvialis]BDG73479.1 hypothetical protein Rmf_34080 [Roseomonas fluvialis]
MIQLLRRLFGLNARDPAAARRAAGRGAAVPRDFRPLEDAQPARDAADPVEPAFMTDRNAAEAPLAAAFTPTQPRTLGPLFIGRETHLRRMIAAVEQERAHIVLFGDRGRGKTSLANGFAALAEKAGVETVRRACGIHTTYERLFRGLLAEIPGRMLRDGNHLASAADLLPGGDFGADEVCDILARLRGRVVLVVDEFDRAACDRLRSEIAETIKTLSDQAANATLLLIGVAGSLEDLLGWQPSVQRAILAIALPPMDDAEVGRLVAAGATAAGLDFEPAAIALIVRLSRGMPYYAHLLSLYTARAAAARGAATAVTRDDAVAGADQVMQKQAAELGAFWSRAMAVPDAEAALVAAALAPFDDDGRISPASLRDDVHAAIDVLCTEAGGSVLFRTDEAGGPRIGFRLPAVAQQVLLKALRAGRLPEADAAPALNDAPPNSHNRQASIAA